MTAIVAHLEEFEVGGIPAGSSMLDPYQIGVSIKLALCH